MTPDSYQSGPVLEYLLKEVSFSTCDNQFFGELEKEMLIPNNLNIHGKLRGVRTLSDYLVRLVFPRETAVGYIKKPLSISVEGGSRILTYRFEDLVNYDDYWWLPTDGETAFSLGLNLLPPFPELKPVGLRISCHPDVAVGLESDVTTKISIEAEEDIDQVSLKAATPMRSLPGVSIGITEYSDDKITTPRQYVASPRRQFPFPRLNLKKGGTLDYIVKTRIVADPANMQFLRCQQDILTTKLLILSESSPAAPPCGVSITDNQGSEIPIQKTTKSTIFQTTAQVMYSPFSAQKEGRPEKPEVVIQAPAQ